MVTCCIYHLAPVCRFVCTALSFLTKKYTVSWMHGSCAAHPTTSKRFWRALKKLEAVLMAVVATAATKMIPLTMKRVTLQRKHAAPRFHRCSANLKSAITVRHAWLRLWKWRGGWSPRGTEVHVKGLR